MATATQLIDIVCQDTGLDSTTGSSDRGIVLNRMNEAYERLVFEAHSNKKKDSATLTAGQEDFIIGTDLVIPDLISFDYLKIIETSGQERILEPVQKRYLLKLREGASNPQGVPYVYSFEYPVLSIYPPVGSSTGVDPTIEFHYTAMPNTLVEDATTPSAGQEKIPTAIPPIFHRMILARLTTIMMLESYDGREDEAAYHRTLYQDDLMKYKHWVAARGQGVQGPYDRWGSRQRRSGSAEY